MGLIPLGHKYKKFFPFFNMYPISYLSIEKTNINEFKYLTPIQKLYSFYTLFLSWNKILYCF